MSGSEAFLEECAIELDGHHAETLRRLVAFARDKEAEATAHAQRFADAEQLVDELEALLARQRPQASPTGVGQVAELEDLVELLEAENRDLAAQLEKRGAAAAADRGLSEDALEEALKAATADSARHQADAAKLQADCAKERVRGDALRATLAQRDTYIQQLEDELDECAREANDKVDEAIELKASSRAPLSPASDAAARSPADRNSGDFCSDADCRGSSYLEPPSSDPREARVGFSTDNGDVSDVDAVGFEADGDGALQDALEPRQTPPSAGRSRPPSAEPATYHSPRRRYAPSQLEGRPSSSPVTDEDRRDRWRPSSSSSSSSRRRAREDGSGSARRFDDTSRRPSARYEASPEHYEASPMHGSPQDRRRRPPTPPDDDRDYWRGDGDGLHSVEASRPAVERRFLVSKKLVSKTVGMSSKPPALLSPPSEPLQFGRAPRIRLGASMSLGSARVVDVSGLDAPFVSIDLPTPLDDEHISVWLPATPHGESPRGTLSPPRYPKQASARRVGSSRSVAGASPSSHPRRYPRPPDMPDATPGAARNEVFFPHDDPVKPRTR
ncbi:hypothetical protein M885DRAFT_506778 [Pelagophyceae sp. CCMP2097]|nr:hypothetical protein M885DRAFT_506778 [Pelagophyceae sp. CCMP2097]